MLVDGTWMQELWFLIIVLILQEGKDYGFYFCQGFSAIEFVLVPLGHVKITPEMILFAVSSCVTNRHITASQLFCVGVCGFKKYCSLQLHLPLFWSHLPFKKTFVCHYKLPFTLPVFVMLGWSRAYVALEVHWRKCSDIRTTLDI